MNVCEELGRTGDDTVKKVGETGESRNFGWMEDREIDECGRRKGAKEGIYPWREVISKEGTKEGIQPPKKGIYPWREGSIKEGIHPLREGTTKEGTNKDIYPWRESIREGIHPWREGTTKEGTKKEIYPWREGIREGIKPLREGTSKEGTKTGIHPWREGSTKEGTYLWPEGTKEDPHPGKEGGGYPRCLGRGPKGRRMARHPFHHDPALHRLRRPDPDHPETDLLL